MQESISRGGKIQFQTFDTSLYGTAHPNLSHPVTRSTQLIWHIKQIPLGPRVLNQLAISPNIQPHSIWYERF